MYKKFFGLDKDPFIVSPDPSFLFSTGPTEKTYARLLYGIQARKGLILLVGEVGTGKTLLLRKLIEQLDDGTTATAFVFNPRMRPAEFLDYVLGDFGVEHDPSDRLLAFKVLQEWLLKRNRLGQASVLIIDEAQNLSPEAFEVVHALSNLETPTEKLLQIILSGQREVEATLRLPALKSVTQRIALRLCTRPLSPLDTSEYIAHRLRVAGGDIKTIFTPGAIKAVAWSSAGIPRLVNLICEHALISGYADERRPVGARTVQEVAREFSLEVAPLSPEDLAEGVLPAPEVGVLTSPATGNTDLPGIPAPPVPMPAETGAGISVASGLISQGEGRVTVATLVAATSGATPWASPCTTQPKEETDSERPAANPLPAVMPAGAPNSAATQILTAAPPLSLMPVVTSTASGGSNPELVQSAGGSGPKEGSGPVTKPAVGDQASAGDAKVPPRKATQPILLKKVAAGRGFAQTRGVPAQLASEPSAAPRWAALVLVLMGLVMGGYYVVASGLLTKAVRGEPSSPNIRPLVSGKSTAGNPPGTYPAIPLATPGPLAPEQSSPVPLSPLAAGAERPVAAASASAVKAPLSVSPLFTPRSAEVQGLPTVVKQAATAAVPPPPQGEIAVVSNVQGAAISVDGHRDPGWTTPQMIKDLSPGVHRIVVSKKGYREAAQSVTVVAGRATSLNAKLTIPRGEIDIATTQQGAEVLIDGKSYGSGPVRAEVDAGKHTFLVRQEGRQSVEGNLVVQDLATVQETITLPSNLAIPPALSASNVTVATIPPSATVYVDGAVMNGNTPISFHLSPGHHIVTISSSGFRPVRRKIDVTDDKPIAVDVILSR